jgi:hypothetical protein
MNNFEIDKPRPAGLLVINNVIHAGIPVRPRTAKIVAVEPMSAPEFVGSRFQHSPRERALVQVFPKAFTRQFVSANDICT